MCPSKIKPINGSWLSIYWENENEMRYDLWEYVCRDFSAQQWKALIKDMAVLGQKYLVLVNTVARNEAIYKSSFIPQVHLGCADPLEAIFSAADEYGMKIFVTNDYYKSYFFDDMFSSEAIGARQKIIEELTTLYGHHESFYGWYWAREACINPYFEEDFIRYVNENSAFARSLTPNAVFLTAPYGTKSALCDDTFVKQLEKLDVDIIAYQDTVGCEQINTDESAKAFEVLYKAHQKVPQRKLWADVETFCWDGPANIVESRLLPAPFSRLEKQLAAVSPFVEDTLVFTFQGLFTNPESIAYTGYADGAEYYKQYRAWLQKNHPEKLRNL